MRPLSAPTRLRHGLPRPALSSARLLRANPAAQPKTQDLATFAENILGFPLEPRQRDLLSAAHRRVILNCSRQWGKSWLAAVALLHHAIHHPGSLAIIAAPTLRQAAELLHKVQTLAHRLGQSAKRDGINRHSLVLPNASRIVAIPASPDGIRGFSGVTMAVIDEAAMVSDALYHALRPMLTQVHGVIWLISTPKSRSGFFHREWTASPEPWHRIEAPATGSPRFTPAMLEAERASLGDRQFAQEFLCQFGSTADGLLDESWLEDSAVLTDTFPPHPVHW